MVLDPHLKQEQLQLRQIRLARSKFRRIHSLDLIPEDPTSENMEESAETAELMGQQILKKQHSQTHLLSKGVCTFLLFWPNLLISVIMAVLRYILYIPFSIAAPSFWLSALLWIFWKLIRIPISVIKWILNSDSLSVASSAKAAAHQRTILISCGSTIQTLHLARNFYSSGSRVVVFEFEGLFGLGRFSTAVDKFYIVPRPTPNNPDGYIAALCHIVRKEKPAVYVPVCVTSPAYYDSLAKPHLELLGCASFIPGLQETLLLDDCLQFYQKCAAQSIPLPPHVVLSSTNDLWHSYDSGFISNFRNILMSVGMQGLLERYKYILPSSRRDCKFGHEISERQQWMVVRDLPGDNYVTCTTVKDSRVVANVSCKVEQITKNLVPVSVMGADNKPTTDELQIDRWLRTFFSKVRFQRSINGHISFRLVKCQATGEFLPLSARVGVSLPYICYRSHGQALCRTMKCVHFKHSSLTGGCAEDETIQSVLSSNWCWPSIGKSNSAAAPLDKREALFVYWDPLPYCAYYHFQLPLESVKMFLQKRRRTTKTLSPVH